MESRDIAREFINSIINIKKYMRAHMDSDAHSPITEQQFRTMMYLRKLDKCTLKELSESVHLSSSSVCTMLNKLWDEGYINRETDTKDRRNTFYSLSDKGKEFIDEELERKLDFVSKKIDTLTDTKKERLLYCIKELEEIFQCIK